MKRLKDVNWNQVYYFYEVAKRLSMKDAAAHLGVSLPTVSEQIKRLEERLEVQLFRREVRRLEMSPDGVKLFQCARDMFEAGYRFIDAVAPDGIGGYGVRVGLQETNLLIATNFVADYWDRFAPFGTVNTVRELYVEILIERLLKNELDWGIVLQAPKVARLETREIGSFEIAFCCSEDVYRRFKRKEDILRSLPLARNSWDGALNAIVEERLRDNNVHPKEIIESDHRQFSAVLAQRGRCVATFATDGLRAAPGGSMLRTFHIGEPIVMNLYAVWNKASQKMIAIRKLREMLDAPTVGSAADPELQLRVSDVPADWLVEEARP